MIGFLKKFTIVFMLAFALFILVDGHKNSQVEAAACAGGVCIQPPSILTALGTMATSIGSAIMQVAGDLLGGVADIFGGFHEAHQNAQRDMAAQRRLADLENRSFDANLANVEAADEYAMGIEDLHYEIAQDNPPPSTLVCRDVVQRGGQQAARAGAAVNSAFQREQSRRGSARTGRPAAGGEGTDLPSSYDGCITPLDCQRHAWEIHRLDCDPEEHNSAAESFCPASLPEDTEFTSRETDVMADKGRTIRDTEKNLVLLSTIKDYNSPVADINPLRDNCMGNDASCNDFYFKHLKYRALSQLHMESTDQAVSKIQEPPNPADAQGRGWLSILRNAMFPTDYSRTCRRMIALHNRFDELEGRTPDSNRPCPSVEEIRHYKVMMMESSHDLSQIFTDHGGNRNRMALSTTTSELTGAFERYQKEKFRLLMVVLDIQDQVE